ncbi:MAG: S9 family peptidase [Phycisphaerae bacterium]|nr:S9 family peptidase [Gemmatimonadaceae bacterium]
MDQQLMNQAGGNAISPDGKWMLYTLSVANWKDAKRYTDIFVVSTEQGVPSTRQLTFTKDKNESAPRWSRDGKFFVFASNRDTPAAGSQQQLFLMRADGGEAQKITDAKDGVGTFAFTRDGKSLIYSAGKAEEAQLWSLPVAGIDTARPTQVTRHVPGVKNWQLADNGKAAFFLASDSVDTDEKLRREKMFTVNVRNAAVPSDQLWTVDLSTTAERRLTSDRAFSVSSFSVSNDGEWIGISAIKNDRYARNITEQNINGDAFLLKVADGTWERLTNNVDVSESTLSFSPDGQWIAFSAANDFTYFRDSKLYIRRRDAAGQSFRKLGNAYDGDVSVGWWSKDGKTVYFSDGIKATTQLLSMDIETDKVTQLTNVKGVLNANYDEASDRILVNYSDPKTPPTPFMVNAVSQVTDRNAWKQLVDANPQVRARTLGDADEVTWKSTDGKMVGGVLLKPVGFQSGKKYPLIVAIHGGPAAADLLSFNGGYGAQAYANAGYVVLMPNYRGSTNYGEAHRQAIVGDYFKKGYEDIMTGVDQLIAQGMVHPDSMGVLGWSAGGHWSNWILTHTNRFKAISSGAGTSNWVSMYAQSDVQRNRQQYLGGKLPYDDVDAYWNQSPLKYIRNAKTPTMIHVVDGDPRVPRPQSDELHMALKKIGVPTEYFVYPGASHGIPDPRNQLVKSVAEMAWMDKWIRGKGDFKWEQVLKTLEETPVRQATIVP